MHNGPSDRARIGTQGAWRGKRFGVIGAGRSGIAAAKLLANHGAGVLLSDAKPRVDEKLPAKVEVESGGHSRRLLECDVIIRSPGVPGRLPILRAARRRRIPVWSELELAGRFISPRWLVAITGTNGKTTTTTLVGKLFAAHRPGDTFVAGNIGAPLSGLIGEIGRRSAVVVEVSSYQLEDIHTFHPTLSAILNITPDHLEHHGTMAAYVNAKARIFENQTKNDICVMNADDAACRRLAERCPAAIFWFSRKRELRDGIFFRDGVLHLRWRGRRLQWPLHWRLPGAHNVENALASIALAVAGGVPVPAIRRAFVRFKGVEHRLELVRELRGVRYINDSKATNVDSTRVALDSFERPLLLILGGRGKGTPYRSIEPLVRRRVKEMFLIGEDAANIKAQLGGAARCRTVETMEKAVRAAHDHARRGDVVLLSPACASFDQYADYEERGRHFKALVGKLR